MIVPVSGNKGPQDPNKKNGKTREDKTALITSITRAEWKVCVATSRCFLLAAVDMFSQIVCVDKP